MSKELQFLVGLPGSGKTTYARSQIAAGAKIVNLDGVRLQLGHRYFQPLERQIYEIGLLMAEAFMIQGLPVVLDEAFVKVSEFVPFIWLAKDYGYTTRGVYFTTPVEVCKQRRDDGEFPLMKIEQKDWYLNQHLPRIQALMDFNVAYNGGTA